MADLLPHNCPKEDYDEVLVPAGKLCPNGCGWLAVDGNAEAFAVAEAQKALELWGPWLKLEEAAEQSGVPFSTLAQATREGRLPTLQLGRQRFVRLSAVQGKIGLHGKRGRPKPVKRVTPPRAKCQGCGKWMSGEYQANLIIAYDARSSVVRCEKCAAKRRKEGESDSDSYFVV